MGSIIIALLVFSFLIFSHELGHFLFAKKCGIGVTEFSIGMGPRLLSRQWGETRYSLKCIPFGGSCAMVGEDEDNTAENAFGRKPVWARILVVAGGPLFNLLTAFLLSAVILAGVGVNTSKVYSVTAGSAAEQAGIQVGDRITRIGRSPIHVGREIEMVLIDHPLDDVPVSVTYEREGETHTVTYDTGVDGYRLGISYYATDSEPVLGEVAEGSPAGKAGLQAGDSILSINNQDVKTGADIQAYFAEHPADGTELVIRYLRAGETLTTVVIPQYMRIHNLGFAASYDREETGALGIVTGSFWEMEYWLRYMVMSLRMLFTGQVGADEVSGPVAIVSTISDTVDESSEEGLFSVWINLLNMAVLLSVNLGVMNLLPIPALDGGRLIFLLFEAVRGKPIPPDKEGAVHMVGFALLMVTMVFVMFHDIMRLFGAG